MRTGRMKPGFGMVQKAVMKKSDISIFAKAVYCLLVSYAGTDDACFPSLNTMCVDLKISKPTVIKSLKELINCGLIEADKRQTSKGEYANNVYYPLLILEEKVVNEINHPVVNEVAHVVKDVDTTNKHIQSSLSNDKECIPPIDLFAALPPDQQPKTKEKFSKKRKVADWHPFEESNYFDIDVLTARLTSNDNFANVNVIYYHQAATVWSDKGNNQKNWLAAIQGFILSDIKKKELVTNDQKDVLSGVNDFSKYLTETLNG